MKFLELAIVLILIGAPLLIVRACRPGPFKRGRRNWFEIVPTLKGKR